MRATETASGFFNWHFMRLCKKAKWNGYFPKSMLLIIQHCVMRNHNNLCFHFVEDQNPLLYPEKMTLAWASRILLFLCVCACVAASIHIKTIFMMMLEKTHAFVSLVCVFLRRHLQWNSTTKTKYVLLLVLLLVLLPMLLLLLLVYYLFLSALFSYIDRARDILKCA